MEVPKGRRPGEPAAAADDCARVIAPPPLIFALFLVAGVGVDWASGAVGWSEVSVLRRLAGGILLLAGSTLTVAAFVQFCRLRTAVEPWRPATAMISAGVYRYSRNPMYVAFAALHLGCGLFFGGYGAVLSIVPALVTIHFGVVLREERYLARKFGAAYTEYRNRVPRWL